MSEPSANGAHGPDGRFLPGNPGGPGNPWASHEQRIRGALMRAMTEEEADKLAKMLIERAMKGDETALDRIGVTKALEGLRPTPRVVENGQQPGGTVTVNVVEYRPALGIGVPHVDKRLGFGGNGDTIPALGHNGGHNGTGNGNGDGATG